jgi:hypothetical protein
MVKEGEAAPPGQIGRMKLFEAGRHRLAGMTDGLVCVTQAGDGELALRFQKFLTLREAGCDCRRRGWCWCSWKVLTGES